MIHLYKLQLIGTNRMNTWGHRIISLAERMVLVKSSFISFPMFLSTHSLVPMGILKDFDKMCINFIWHKQNGNQGLHYISWEVLCLSKNSGGHDLHSAILKVGPLRVKFAWNFITKPNSLLNKNLIAKYDKEI